MKATYQLLWLGNAASQWRTELDEAVRLGLRNLGLDPEEAYTMIDSTGDVDWRFPIACVWAAEEGHDSSGRVPSLREVVQHGAPVFPVIQDLTRYQALMPTVLHPVNGMEWSRGAERLTGEILNSFGLARRDRSVFISYMRKHSRAVALQLLHKLTDHGYRPFLDTASIEFGDRVQESLWDSLANIDFLLFLDTPGAISSHWVEGELTRAHNLGMGTLQLQWPGWRGAPGTDLSSDFKLKDSEFEAEAPHQDDQGNPNPEGRIRNEILEEIVKTCERVRMRSIGSRRIRISGEIMRRAAREGMEAVTDHTGPVVVLRAGLKKASVLPVAGFPDSPLLFERRRDFNDQGIEFAMAYDGLGIKNQRLEYLNWLNQQLTGFQSIPMMDLSTWLKAL